MSYLTVWAAAQGLRTQGCLFITARGDSPAFLAGGYTAAQCTSEPKHSSVRTPNSSPRTPGPRTARHRGAGAGRARVAGGTPASPPSLSATAPHANSSCITVHSATDLLAARHFQPPGLNSSPDLCHSLSIPNTLMTSSCSTHCYSTFRLFKCDSFSVCICNPGTNSNDFAVTVVQ